MNKNLKAGAYEKLKNMILLGELQQGEKIFELDIAKSMGISRTPVREALITLEKENLVENKDRLGFVVRRLKYSEVKRYYELREIMEQYAVPLIIANITDEDLEKLQDNITQSERLYAEGDNRNFIIRCSEFHDLLSETTRCDIFNRVMSSLNDISIFLRVIASKDMGGAEKSIIGHKAIVEVLKTKSTEKLRKALVKHLVDSKTKNEALVKLIF